MSGGPAMQVQGLQDMRVSHTEYAFRRTWFHRLYWWRVRFTPRQVELRNDPSVLAGLVSGRREAHKGHMKMDTLQR